jgi:hypothetical protein
VWWLASIIGLESGLANYIDTLQEQESVPLQAEASKESTKVPEQDRPHQQVHPDQVSQISEARSVSAVHRDLTEDQPLDRILESAERVITDSFRDRSSLQRNRVNPLPQTKIQLKKARKVKCLQEANRKKEVERNQRLQEIRATVVECLSRE